MKTNKNIQIEHCALCVIGTGVSGLNALNSSIPYLGKNDKIIVVDKRDPTKAIGGMWNTAYDFVRLHQPHGLFTVGNKKWGINKPASYLANKEEIITHFQYCYQEIKKKSFIVEKFGYAFQSHEEVQGADGFKAHITIKSTDADKPDVLIKAKKCIKSFGFNILPNEPMQFSSHKVQSTVPEAPALLDGEIAQDDKPIYIVGGGKTAIDVAKLIITQNKNRKVNFIIGKGIYFFDREKFCTSGIKKNWQGILPRKLSLEYVAKYNENDLGEAIESIKGKYGLTPFKNARHCMSGILSAEENTLIKNGIDNEIYEYLEDVKESNGTLTLHYRSGKTQEVEENSWFINCTGFILPKDEIQEPILSTHGTVLSIQGALSAFPFTSLQGYFLPHLWFRDAFKKTPINQFNYRKLAKADKEAFIFGTAAQLTYNSIQFAEALPLSVLTNCGLNYDNWFPFHRQFPTLLKMRLRKNHYLNMASKVLAHLDEKYGIENGSVGNFD